MGLFFVLVITKVRYPKRFSEFLWLPITDKYFAIEGKEHGKFHPFTGLLLVFQLGSLAFLIFLGIDSDSVSSFKGRIFIQIFSGVLLFTLFKYYLEKLVAYVLGIDALVTSYLYEKISYLNWVGIVLWTGAIFVYFNPWINHLSLPILLIVYTCLYLLSFIVCIKRISKLIFNHFFYFILYLCALEIAPYVILYKVFV